MDPSSKPAEGHAAAPGILGSVIKIIASARHLVAEFLALVTLEIRRAGLTLMWLVALGVLAALLIITAWFGLMAALAFWLASLGAAWPLAIAAVALLNVLLAGAVVFIGIVLSRNLLFPATRRQFERD